MSILKVDTIAPLTGDSMTISGSLLFSTFSGSFSGSFDGDGSGLTGIVASEGTASYVELSNVDGSASLATRLTGLESFSSSLDTIYATDAELNAATASLSSSLGSSISANSASISTLDTTTVKLTGDQTIGGNKIFNGNISVNGTASFAFIQSVTGSSTSIGDAFIILNEDTPASNFAGIKVVDSGSTFTTASFIYDGLNNNWIFDKAGDSPDSGSSITIFGPLNTGSLGSEIGLTENRIPKAVTDHGHHIGDSNISDNGTTISLGSDTQVTGSLTVSGGITGTITTASYVEFNNVANKPALVSGSSQIFAGYDHEIHVSQVDGNDTTGNGDLLTPVASITKALTLTTSSRKTIIVHPGTYSENITVGTTNTTIATFELTGANTLLSGTLTIGTSGSGTRISGLKMTNLVISGTAQAYISNCTIDDQVTKSSSGYVEIINSEMQCTSGIQISGAGITIINGNKNVGIAVSNASAQVIIKGCNSVVTPSASAGNLAIVDCIVTALGGNGITITGASTTLTLLNSQVLVQAGNNVAPISVAGIYSIINTIYDKPGSTLTGTSTNSVDYFQYINADNITSTNGLTVTGSLTVTGGITGSAASASYVEYTDVANKPTLVSGSSQVTYSGLTGIPAGIVSGSSQVSYTGLSNIPSGIVSGSSQLNNSTLSGMSITGSFTGSFKGDGSALTGLPPGYSVTNSSDNRIITSVDSTSGNAEANLTFNGTSLNITGGVTASAGFTGSFKGDGSSLTGLPAGYSVSNSSDNRVITSVDSTSGNAEANLTFNGTALNITGNVTASAGFSGNLSGNATSATNATNFDVEADNSTNATHYIIFTGGATGNQRPNSDTALTYNPSTNLLSAGCFVETSALRCKDNIHPINSPLDKVKQLKPVTFDWKHSGKNDIGFIAEEVNEVLPNLIHYNEEGEVEGMNYSKITSLLVAAIQEQQEQINELKQEINNLKNK